MTAPAVDGALEVRVSRRWQAATRIVALELRAADGRELPPFEPGSFIDVATPAGILRPYSLCGSPRQRDRYRIAVLLEREGRGGSRSIHEEVHEGMPLRIGRPVHEFALRRDAVFSVLLAGGIGIAPLLSMAEDLWRRGAPFRLHYTARGPDRAAFVDELLHSPYQSRVVCHWTQPHGRPRFDDVLRSAPAGSMVYACGPRDFIHAVVGAQHVLGRPAEHVRIEPF